MLIQDTVATQTVLFYYVKLAFDGCATAAASWCSPLSSVRIYSHVLMAFYLRNRGSLFPVRCVWRSGRLPSAALTSVLPASFLALIYIF